MTLRTLIFVFAVAVAAPAAAQDFTFVVPVDVKNLPPEIDGMQVSCAVAIAPGTPGLPSRLIGSNSVRVPISGGAYRGDVTVTFNATLAGEAGYANEYSCNINEFSIANSRGRVYYTAYSNDLSRFFPLDTTATYRIAANGRLGNR